MKKAVFLPILIVIGFASQVWADYTLCTGDYAGYCLWGGPEECYSINKDKDDKKECAAQYDNCLENGYLYNDAKCTVWSEKGNDPSFTVVYCKWSGDCEKVLSENAKDHCEETNGTLYSDNKCTDRIGGKDPSTALGCCKWDTGTDCWTIWEGIDPEDNKDGTEKVTDCKRGKNVFWNGACPTTSLGACPAGTPVYDGRSSSSVNTANSSSSNVNASSSSTVTTSSSSATGGSSSSGSAGSSWAYCIKDGQCYEGPYTYNECSALNGVPSNSCSSPIILPQLVHSNSLNAMQNAVNLQITSDAAIQIFDLKGNAVRTLKLAQGNYIVPLSDLPHGLYIVKAGNASWKQTVKVAVK